MKTGSKAVAIGLLASLPVMACNGNTSASRESEHAPAVSTGAVSVRPAVAWPAASTIDDRPLVALARERAAGNGAVESSERRLSEVRALVSRSPVPVLVPRDLRLATPTLVVEGEYFALTGRVDGVTIALQGTRAAHRYDGVQPVAGNRDLRGNLRGFVSVNEGIRTASWIENGAAYSVDLECADFQDARCQNDDFLLSVVTQLTYVGGSGR